MKRLLLATAAVLTPAAWLAAASAGYLAIQQRMDLFAFPYAQWAQAAPWWRYTPWTTFAVAASAAAPTAVLAALAYAAIRRPRKKLVAPAGGGLKPIEHGVTDNHGHARWATEKELVERFGKPRGLLIGAVERGGRLLHDPCTEGPTHSLIFSGPGSFKSTSAVSRLHNWGGPAVVFDPSLEIGPVMTEALEARGYRVTNIALDGSGIDALDWIDPRHKEAEVHIRTAVDAIYDVEAGNKQNSDGASNPFWSMWGKSLVACLMAHMIYSDGPKNLKILREDLISTPESEMQPLLETVSRNSPSPMARDLARGLMGMRAVDTFSGIYANAFGATMWLATGVYADLLSRPSIKTSDILQPNSIVFIQTKMATLQATPAIGRAIISSLMNALYQADGNVEERILFLFDEAWLLRRMKEIELAFATARKYRGTVQLMYQSEGQMEGIWGRDGAKMLRDSASWRSYSAIQDGEVAERLSRDIGEYGVMAYSEGDNTGRQTQFAQAFGSKSTGRNTNVHEIKRRVIKAEEVLRAEPDETFVLARGVPHPIKCYAAPYFRYPEIARKMGENRFARAG